MKIYNDEQLPTRAQIEIMNLEFKKLNSQKIKPDVENFNNPDFLSEVKNFNANNKKNIEHLNLNKPK